MSLAITPFEIFKAIPRFRPCKNCYPCLLHLQRFQLRDLKFNLHRGSCGVGGFGKSKSRDKKPGR